MIDLSKSLEQSLPEYITTGTIARYCGVTSVTVLRWIRQKQLAAFRLPGGHYRIHRNDFGNFLAKYNIPMSKRMARKRALGQDT